MIVCNNFVFYRLYIATVIHAKRLKRDFIAAFTVFILDVIVEVIYRSMQRPKNISLVRSC